MWLLGNVIWVCRRWEWSMSNWAEMWWTVDWSKLGSVIDWHTFWSVMEKS